MVPPLALDIDGTLTTPEHTIDPRTLSLLASWEAPVVLATGKAFPYPVALCHFAGVPERVIAENGGVAMADGDLTYAGDPERVDAAVEAFEARGGDLGWDGVDTVNRWRETEVAASRTADEALLRAVAEEFDLAFLDTGYAYHLTSADTSKGAALGGVAERVGYAPEDFVAVGDSENDASMFDVAGEAYAVANADETAKGAADHVLERGYVDGTLDALSRVRERAP
ncbi:phosphoglycolate phosphatase [Halolamina litorea]|uniref:Phosphoglycolate phosphatase n=1 Tax=Halolamina litorea TaxID=1515593 RepID=A0ABD6BV47_9EURY|nr:HAD-IIB family hydrolase [Halolamina litorea]